MRPAEPAEDDHGNPDPEVERLLDDLEDLEEMVDEEDREQVRESIRSARRLGSRRTFGNVIRGFDRHDAAEAFVGSVIFGIPMLVEGGTLEVGEFVAARPPLFVGTVGVAVALVIGLLYVADIQRVEVADAYFGIVPRRLAGVLLVSALTATVSMTGWGRVDWAEPWVATCQVAVCFFGMAVGAALGDILPGS